MLTLDKSACKEPFVWGSVRKSLIFTFLALLGRTAKSGCIGEAMVKEEVFYDPQAPEIL